MLKKSGLFLSFCLFLVPQILMVFVLGYLNILPQEEFKHLVFSPYSWLLTMVVPSLYYFLFKKAVSPVLLWKRDPSSVDADRVSKAVITIPKIVLIGGALYGMILPQVIMLLHPHIPLGSRLDLSLVGYSCIMFFGIPFYIPFIRHFETWCEEIPFRKEYMSMKIPVRTNLVVFFLFSSILIIVQLGIKYELKNAVLLDQVQSTLQQKLLPLELLGVVMGIYSISMLMKGINHRIHQCQEYTEVLASGDFTGNKKPCISRDELGDLYESLNMVLLNNAELLRGLNEPVQKTMNSKDAVLNVSLDTSSSIEQISRNIQSVSQRMDELNNHVRESMETTGSLSENITYLGSSVDEQSEMVSDSSGAIEEITSSIDNLTSVAHDKIQSAEALVHISDEGKQKLDNTVEKINRINESVENIRAILSLIQNISARTNLLAMNAAIEAAHAGDAGRGFAVVADEIRKLAETSSTSSRQINDNIGNIIAVIQETSEAGGEAIRSFDEITTEINSMINSFREINAGLGELKNGSGMILGSVTGLKNISLDVKKRSDDMNVMTANVNSSLDKLHDIFKDTSKATLEMHQGSEDVKVVVEMLKGQSRVLDEASRMIVDGLGKFRF